MSLLIRFQICLTEEVFMPGACSSCKFTLRGVFPFVWLSNRIINTYIYLRLVRRSQSLYWGVFALHVRVASAESNRYNGSNSSLIIRDDYSYRALPGNRLGSGKILPTPLADGGTRSLHLYADDLQWEQNLTQSVCILCTIGV